MTTTFQRLHEYLKNNLLLCLCSIAVIAVLFQVLQNELTWDDIFVIEQNPYIGNLAAFPTVISGTFWENSSYIDGQTTVFWRPAVNLLLWFVGFLGRAPFLFHLLSVVVAFGATSALSSVIQKLFFQNTKHHPVAYFTALVYLAHPLTAEVICLVANLSDHLCLMFGLLSLRAILEQLQTPGNKKRLLFIYITALLSCSSKEFGILCAAYPVFASILLWAAQNKYINLFKKKHILLWASSVLPALTYLSLRNALGHHVHFSFSFTSIAPFMLGIGQSAYYILNIAPSGNHVYVAATDVGAWIFSFAVLLGIGIAGTLAFFRTRRPSFLAVSSIFGLCLLLPSLAGARYDYLGIQFPLRYFHLLLVGIVLGLPPLIQKIYYTRLRFLMAITIILLCSMSWIKVQQWSTFVTLSKTELNYNPNSPDAVINYCEVLISKNAFSDAQKILDTYDTRFSSSPNIGYKARVLSVRSQIAFARDGEFDEALELAWRAFKLSPYSPLLISRLVQIGAAKGDYKQSLGLLDHALGQDFFTPAQKQQFEEDKRNILLIQKSQKNRKTQ